MKILHIDSSANLNSSLSRSISKMMVDELKAKYPESSVSYRDVSANPIPFVDATWLENGGHEMTSELIQEFLDADIYVFGVPVYNLSIPASFKAYIDQIVIAGSTFSYTPQGPKGLVPAGKKMFVISASSTSYEILTQYNMNFHDSYLKGIFAFIGVTDVNILPFSARTPEQGEAEVTRAKTEIKEIVSKM